MLRTIIAPLAVIAVALSLTACAPSAHGGAHGAHPAGSPSARPHPAATHASAAPSATPTGASAAHLSTSPGDELLTFTGTGHSTDGSAVAVTFTVHAPVAWNSAAGASTLAAIAASGSARLGDPRQDLRDTAWDAANAVSLAVVDYSATVATGSWRSGEKVEISLGPWESEVAVAPNGLTAGTHGSWLLTAPGSGHFVIAYKNINGATPDPSAWADALQIYGLGGPQEDGTTPASYQFTGCRITITPLGRESAGVADWFSPTDTYCYAGIGE
ncbi:MAG: hypothetical protein ABIS08_00930 [Pseudolysinimonas sp.]